MVLSEMRPTGRTESFTQFVGLSTGRPVPIIRCVVVVKIGACVGKFQRELEEKASRNVRDQQARLTQTQLRFHFIAPAPGQKNFVLETTKAFLRDWCVWSLIFAND